MQIKLDKNTKTAATKVWLPEGRWTDIFTGDEYVAGKGGKKITLYRKRDSIPVLAKAGGVLPLSMDKGNGCDNPEKLEVRIYNGDGEYVLAEDGAEKGTAGAFKTVFTNHFVEKEGTGTQITEIYGEGDACVIPKNRTLRLRYENIKQGEIVLYIDGKRRKVNSIIADCATVEIPMKAGVRYRVEVRFALLTTLEKLKERALKVITRAEWANTEKYTAWKRIEQVKTIEEYRTAVHEENLPTVTKAILRETL